jgi:uncharacterized protein (TIGR02679 family)
VTVPDALARPALAPLWRAARRRLERNGGRLTAVPVTVAGLDAEGRDALAGILGVPRPPDEPVRVRLPALDAALRRSAAGTGVVEVLEALGPPLRDRRAERAVQAADRDELRTEAVDVLAAVGFDAAEGWIARLRRTGLLARLGDVDARPLLRQTAAVLGRLERGGSLAALAASVAHDSHALDRGRPLGRLVCDALAFADGVPPPATVSEWRALWERHDIACDDLSSDVLVLNLRPSPGTLAAGVLGALADAGEPGRLTLRLVEREDVVVPGGTRVHVCENPAVVAAAADALGAAAAPVVCVAGQPSSAALALLRTLASSGAVIAYHGDFDWSGVAIGNHVLAVTSGLPWRFMGADYRAAASGASLPLTGREVAASWDPDLAPAMRDAGVAVHEEQVLAALIDDLAP